MTTPEQPLELSGIARVRRWALLTGAVGLAACIAGAFIDREQFFRSYLVAFLFSSGLSIGCLGLLMLHYLMGGRWGLVTRRILEAGAGTLPFVLVASLPHFAGLALGFHDLYPWAESETAEADRALQHKAPYLNVPFFLVRAALCFAVWIALAVLLRRWSSALDDRAGGARAARRLRLLSGPGILLLVLTRTVAAVDWAMSLEPHFVSSIYGIIFIVGDGAGAFALVILFLALLADTDPFPRILDPPLWGDLGNLLLAFVLLWTYVSFSQFLIIWSANLPEEAAWYLSRSGEGWTWVAISLVAIHFVIPFLALLSRRLKRKPSSLAAVAGIVLCGRLLDAFWVTAPAFHPRSFHFHWMDVLVPLSLGAIWVVVFLRGLAARPLLPSGPLFARAAHLRQEAS